jgi:hypothetical protein
MRSTHDGPNGQLPPAASGASLGLFHLIGHIRPETPVQVDLLWMAL